jgi:hypothetical protein
MADNITLNAGSGGSVVAADDISSVWYQRNKITLGTDGVNDGDVSSSNPMPVAILDATVTGNITTQNLVPAGTATANSAVLSGDLKGFGAATVQVTGTYTGALSLQYTVDNSTWVTNNNVPAMMDINGAYLSSINSGNTGIYFLNVAGVRQFRITGLAAMTGTATVTIRVSNAAGMPITPANIRTTTNQIGGVTIASGNGTATAGSQRVTIASDNTAFTILATGNTADDSPASGNPVPIGLTARQTNRTAVGDGDVVRQAADDIGRAVVAIGQVRDLMVHQHTQIASTAAETTVLSAGAAGVFHDITQIVLTNQTATAVNCTLKDATAGTTRMIIALAASGGAVIPFSRPMNQAAAANNWTITLSSAAVTVNVFVQAEKNV